MAEPTPETELYTRALEALKEKISGYTLEESKKTYIYEKGRKRIKDEVTSRKTVGPDLAAIQFVLTNLNPQQWSYKPDNREDPAGQGQGDKPDLSRLSAAALEELNRLCEE